MRKDITVLTSGEKPVSLPNFCGVRADGDSFSVNSRTVFKNEKPWLPVMGEFHFSRWPAEEWEHSLRKMKAAGIEIVASYIFWIHHEEEKGIWDFSGQRDLRRFLQLCQKVGLMAYLRIGPWCHGECRNGGFPDWLQQDKTLRLRVNHPQYLHYVTQLYQKIAEQTKGLLWKDGGPVIGVQLENEYGEKGDETCAGGSEHILTLKKIAVNSGIEVPFYSATGWGNTYIAEDETLPFGGCYADYPWASELTELPENEQFLITRSVNDPLIGTDILNKMTTGVIYHAGHYPVCTCELGAGVQVSHHRRVVIPAMDTEALALCKLGSGANWIGYYMFHGGVNPDGKLSGLNESKETGYPNDVPVKSYDFQAPIGETGEIRESYRRLKAIHMLLQEWGEIMAETQVVIPSFSAVDPADLESLRVSVRHNAEKNCGFLFINNHMRKRTMQPHENVCFRLSLPEGEMVCFPPVDLKTDDMRILPYRLKLGEATLLAANAQPLTRIKDRWFFFSDQEPIYQFEGGKAANITTLTSEEARNAWRFGDRLYVTDCAMTEKEGKLFLEAESALRKVRICDENGLWTEKVYQTELPDHSCVFREIDTQEEGSRAYSCELQYLFSGEESPDDDVILTIDYNGDRAQVCSEGKLLGDWFTSGLPFRLPLKRYGFPTKITVQVYRTEPNIYYDVPVTPGCSLNGLELKSLRVTELT